MRVFLTASALEKELCAEAYDNWLKSEYETEDEFIERKHGVDLADLLKRVIEEKLNDKEKAVIECFWFYKMTPKEIALKTNTGISSVYKLLDAAEKKLHMYLEYVVVYQDSLIKRELVPVSVRQAISDTAVKSISSKTVGERLKKLRVTENIPVKKLEASINMPMGRLKIIESGEILPDIDELIKLTAFFGTSADYILFGKKG